MRITEVLELANTADPKSVRFRLACHRESKMFQTILAMNKRKCATSMEKLRNSTMTKGLPKKISNMPRRNSKGLSKVAFWMELETILAKDFLVVTTIIMKRITSGFPIKFVLMPAKASVPLDLAQVQVLAVRVVIMIVAWT